MSAAAKLLGAGSPPQSSSNLYGSSLLVHSVSSILSGKSLTHDVHFHCLQQASHILVSDEYMASQLAG
jgi:hypothetical protein